ncbi:hypothetical protein BDD43_3849 [Mucilaginibacter gracilis]|uniref:ABC-2 type transport system permease protein n=1 Tax=Mucilaginibacter gracilis TaxID=423350 RepID=A0A495J5F3_9SPHI|nr:hypothetical protein [Mucilaginibacter gracilis]RKR83638.1 hypothetical protein BDD43_3849 [Mucilaginibacter gracilis]
MNNIFSLKRFAILFKKHTIEHYKGYLMSLGVLFGLLAISFGSSVFKSKMPVSIGNQMINYIVCLLLSGTIFTSNVFNNLGDKRKTIATLTLPASIFEKYMVGWVYSYLIFQILFTALFYALLFIISIMGNWPAGSVHYLDLFSADQKVYFVFPGYIILHAITLYGAIYFKKMHFIKTASSLFIIGLILWVLNDQVLEAVMGVKISGNPPFGGLSFNQNNQFYNLEMGDMYFKWTIILFMVLSAILWAASYFRLKEKQV